MNLISSWKTAGEVTNPLVPAWFDVAFSLIPIVVVVSMIVGLVSIARHRARLSTFETLGWSVFVIVAPVIGTLVWLVTTRRSLVERASTE